SICQGFDSIPRELGLSRAAVPRSTRVLILGQKLRGPPMNENTQVVPRCSKVCASIIFAASIILFILGIVCSSSSRENSSKARVWLAHRQAGRQLPASLYHQDRFRQVQGQVSDARGKPIVGATVSAINVQGLARFAASGVPRPSRWSQLVEAEIKTDDSGH